MKTDAEYHILGPHNKFMEFNHLGRRKYVFFTLCFGSGLLTWWRSMADSVAEGPFLVLIQKTYSKVSKTHRFLHAMEKDKNPPKLYTLDL